MKTLRDPDCPRAWDIPEFLQGRLAPDEHRRVEEHIRECPECAKIAADFRFVLDRLEKEHVASRVLFKSRAGFNRMRRWSACAVAAVVLLVALWSVRGLSRSSPARAGASEEAVALREARAWLESTQELDGSWDARKWGAQEQYRAGLSALAIMAYIAATPTAQLSMEAVERCAAYLVSQQDADGRFGPFGSCTPYNHALCTLALLEAYALSPRNDWKTALDRALAYIETQQRASGAWGYPRRASDEGNSSITIWNIRTLQRAEALGWTRTRGPLRRAYAWLRMRVDETGRVGYRQPYDFPFGYETLTAGALLCALNDSSALADMPVQRMLSVVLEISPENEASWSYYSAFFVARALDAARDESAAQQIARWRRILAQHASRQGPYHGSCEPNDRWSAAGGRIYATAMAVLAMTAGAPNANTM